MHRAALAAAESVFLAEDFLHHAVGVDALGNAMTVASMRGGYGVTPVEVHADSDARGLFAGIQMDEARNVAGREFVVYRLFELADRPHALVGCKKVAARQLQAARH